MTNDEQRWLTSDDRSHAALARLACWPPVGLFRCILGVSAFSLALQLPLPAPQAAVVPASSTNPPIHQSTNPLIHPSTNPLPLAAAAPSAVVRAEVYGRATSFFGDTLYFKPAQATGVEVYFRYAPLIIQEAGNSGDPARLRQDQFGSLTFSNGLPALDLSRPAIYANLDQVQLNGRPHARLAYLWCYSLPPGQPGAGLPWQGIRLTLNLAGEPAVWEVLADDSPAALIFVSENLEAAARAQFGKPLPGRRFAVERGLEEAPRAIVARVLDDAPVPMGPIVYQRAGTRSVSTIICRCMASQAKGVLATSTYDLRPLPVASTDALLAAARAPAKSPATFWPGDEPATANRLEHCLRLPAGF